MTSSFHTLSALLRYSLFQGPVPQSPCIAEEWDSLLAEAQKQAVTALILDALLAAQNQGALQVPKPVLFRLVSRAETIMESNRKRSQALIHFARNMQTLIGVDTVVVKGSSLARLYPRPLCRECGDNDVYFGALAPRVDTQLRSSGYAVDTRDPRHSTFVFDGVPFENHSYLLYREADPVWQTRFMHPAGIQQLSPHHTALFVAAHLEHHAVFFNEPVPLGRLLDWAMLLQSGELNYQRFNALKQDFEVNHFADLLTQYCIRLFGLQPPTGWNPLSPQALQAFESIYLRPQPRHPLALVRVVRRSGKYIRNASVYKEIYGQSPFLRFYFRNIFRASAQLITGKPRTSRG